MPEGYRFEAAAERMYPTRDERTRAARFAQGRGALDERGRTIVTVDDLLDARRELREERALKKRIDAYGPRGLKITRNITISQQVARRNPSNELRLRAAVIAARRKSKIVSLSDLQAAALEFDTERRLAQAFRPETLPAKTATPLGAAYQTDIVAIAHKIRDCIAAKGIDRINRVSIHEHQDDTVARVIVSVNIRPGTEQESLDSVRAALAAIESCTLANIEFHKGSNTWFGINFAVARQDGKKWSEVDEIKTSYPKNNRRGTVSRDPYHRELERAAMMRQLGVDAYGGVGYVRRDAQEILPLREYFSDLVGTPERLGPLSNIVKVGRQIDAITLILERFSSPAGSPQK